MAFTYDPSAMAANCALTPASATPATLNFGASLTADSLVIPEDAPTGIAIYDGLSEGSSFLIATGRFY